jgi:acetyl-CoA carboxylase biotin carboxyl carrier protein
MSAQPQPPVTAPAGGRLAELAQVHEHAVGLLGQLGGQPSSLHIRVGDIAVDITWEAGSALPGAPPPVAAAGPEQPCEAGTAEPREYLTAPTVGVFYRAKEPGAEPFVTVGSLVEPGQQVGIVEAMKLMIPVESDRAGVITDVLKSNGAPVEYAEPLFAIAGTEA